MNSIFSSNLKNLRLDNDYSQIQISKKLGLSRSTYSNYENGISEPNIDMIIKISKLFNCSIDDLLNNKVYTDILTKKPTLSIDLNKSDINQLKQKLINDKLYYENYLKIFNLEIPKKINDISALLYYLDNFNITSNISKLNIEINEVFESNISMQYNNIIDFSNYKNEVAEEISPYIEPKTYTPILYLGKVSAGKATFAFENIIDEYHIDSSKLCNSKDYFILKVDGDSMNKLYYDGDLILIEKTNLVDNNDLVIALVNDNDALFKRVLIDRSSNEIGLQPESSNSIHKTQYFNKESIHILGKVLGALNNYID